MMNCDQSLYMKFTSFIERIPVYFQKGSQLLISKLIWLAYISISLYITHLIFKQIQDLEVKQLLLGVISIAIFFRVHSYLLSIRSARYARGSDFNDALASELMRVQWKLDQLVNNIYPYFKTPKERTINPIQDNIYFREFVRIWQAYHTYPGVATCEILDTDSNRKEKYTLCLRKTNVELEKDRIYLSNVDNKIVYSMMAAFDTPVHNVVTDIEAPKKFTLNSLNKLKDKIVWFAVTQGHIELSAIIFLKKTDGFNHYDPLGDAHKGLSKQDLINLNTTGPLSFKTISIKKGSILKAYIYDRGNLGFLRPDESIIKVISIDRESADEFGGNKTFTVEIQPIWGGYNILSAGKKRGKSVLKTISYYDGY